MSSQLRLNLAEGSVSFSFPPEAAQELKAAIDTLMTRLKTVAQNSVRQNSGGQRPTPQKPMEYCHTGPVFLEVFCNPNIWPSPSAAKVFVTLRDEQIRLNTEAELMQLIEDLNQFLEQSA